MVTFSPTIRLRLVSLVMAVVLPTVGISIASAIVVWRSSRAAIESELRQRAQALAFVVQREFETAGDTLRALALSPDLGSGDLEAFRGDIVRASGPNGDSVTLYDPSGNVLVSTGARGKATAVPVGTSAAMLDHDPTVWRVFDTGPARLATRTTGSAGSEAAIAVEVPILWGNQIAYRLTMSFPPAALTRILEEQRPQDSNWVATLVDDRGVTIARTPEPNPGAGPEAERAAATVSPVYAPTIAGHGTFAGVSPLPGARWATVIAVRRDAIAFDLWRLPLATAIVGGIALLAGLLGALYQARRISRSITALASTSQSPVPGSNPRTSGVREVEEVARALAEADSALRDSETRLRLALRSAGLGAWENDLVKGNNLWDAQMAALLGFPSVERTGSTARALPLVHPDDRERVRLAYNHAAASGEPYREEFRIRRQDGAERILLSHGVLASTGRMVGVSQDMTDIRASEAAARQALGELNAIYDTAPVGLCVLDAQMRYVHLNARLAEINGIPLEAHVGRTVREVVPAIADAVEAVHHRVMQTGEPSLGLELGADHWPPDGSPRVWDQDWLPLRDDTGRVIGVNVVIEDVTQKRFAERALVESEARFRMLADVMPQVVWSTGPEGVHDYVNARWFEFTGLAQEAATPGISNEQRWSFSVHPDDLGRSIDLWRRSLRTGEPYEREHRMLRHDGVYRWVLSRAMPMRDEAGVVTRWFGTTTDIDDTVAAREALTRSSEDLERLVAERTRDLETTQARLAQAQRMEALGQLAGGIAHDFNNVLQSVQGCAELIERRSGDNERVRGLARTVMEAASRGSAVTGRLLAFARRGKLRAEAVDVEAMLDGLAEILTHTLGTGLDVRIEASAQLAPLFADKGQLETVLVNLATNARDAMAGNGALTLAARMEMVKRSGRIRHPAGLPTGEYVRLSVADTGAGMAPEVLARASEPFFTTKPLAQGTGLGLAMARGFAEQSGGGMRIESTPGQGTTVMLWFPVAGCGAHPASLSPRPPDLSFATAIGDPPIRLLLVDDDATVRETLAEQLEDAGYTVLRARDGEDALSLLDGGKAVDLMLSDLSMPGMDGVALIAAAQRLRPGLPAILLTGFATNATEIAADGAAAGAFSLLRKPIDVRHLTERVSDLLKQRALICG